MTNIKNQKWNWIADTLRKEDNSLKKMVLDCNPQNNRQRGRPKNTWKRSHRRNHQTKKK